MKRLFKFLLNRITLTVLLLIIQVIFILLLIIYVSAFWKLQTIFYIISVIIVINLIAKDENPAYQIVWIIPILVFPVIGGLFYLFYRRRSISPGLIRRHLEIEAGRGDYTRDLPAPLSNREANYLRRLHWPSFESTETKFLDSGESFFENILNDIKKAERYIFLEFFIIKKGYMWNSILSILKEKARQGVEIILIYDDFGCAGLPYHYPKKLASFGIKVYQFNKMKIRLNFGYNYRNHRKIIVIDGRIGYSGSSNIADEYINRVSPFGHWLDAGIRLEGDAVRSLVNAFFSSLRFVSNIDIDYNKYYSSHSMPSDGFVIPFADTPLNEEESTKYIYISLINSAKRSIKITTPYLIIDMEFKNTLKYAAMSGIDISIIIPGIPDKKIIYMVTESYIPELMNAGVKFYRYSKGFIHSKMMIIDDEKAMIGTANLDYRSLFLHFENSVYLENTSSIIEMKNFYKDIIKSCDPVSNDEKKSIIYYSIASIFKVFQSLM